MEDREIVRLFFARDEDAIARTAEKYGARLIRISRDIVEDRSAAEECENDTYLDAWNRIPPHDPSDYLFAFLARIIRNRSLNVCRARNRLKRRGEVVRLTAELEEVIPAPDDDALRIGLDELGEAVGRYLLTLEPEKRIIFMRRYWYLDPVAVIAERMGIGQSKVKMTLSRCRVGLREWLRKEGYAL